MKTLIQECPYTELKTRHKYIIQRKQGNKYVYLEGVFYDVACIRANDFQDENIEFLKRRNEEFEFIPIVPPITKNVECGSIIEATTGQNFEDYDYYLTFINLKKVNISKSIDIMKYKTIPIEPGDIPPPPIGISLPGTPPGTPPGMSRIIQLRKTCIISVEMQVMQSDIVLYKVEDFKNLLEKRGKYFEKTSNNILKGKTTIDPTHLSKRISEYLRPSTGGKSRKHKRIHRNRTIKRM